jgi:hypothetical protein
MTALLCPSPALLDQSFPRDVDELRLIGVALGEITGCVQDARAELLITDALREFVEFFEWENREDYALLNEIYRLLGLLLLQPEGRVVNVMLDSTIVAPLHPVPVGTQAGPLVDYWQIEMGKLKWVHDQCCDNADFAAIACERAFAGGECADLANPDDLPAFRLVGSEDLDGMGDAYEWITPKGVRGWIVSVADAARNVTLLGASAVEPPSSGSHYKVRFRDKRPWMLDRNEDPQREEFLKQLVPITGYPLEVVIYTLIQGEFPPRVLRLRRVPQCAIS